MPEKPVTLDAAAMRAIASLAAAITEASATIRAVLDAGAVQAPPKRGAWLTEPRRALLRELWPREKALDAIMLRLAALDGPPIPEKRKEIRQAANRMGLRRPEGFYPNLLVARNRRGKVAPAAAAPASPPAPPSPVAPIDTAPPPAPVTPAVWPVPVVDGPQALPVAAPPAPVKQAAAAPLPAPRVTPHARPGTAGQPVTEPITASKEALIDQARKWGMHMVPFDLDSLNCKAADLGHPGFICRRGF